MGQYNNIPQGWMETSLGELIDIYNQKRIPLSTQVRNSRQGIYPYYGASNIVDYIDDYIFDGEFLLISEDGENLNTRNTPIAFIAKGKFWVNNHAHIVKGKSEHLTKYLELYFSKLDISAFITGAVQPKLSKGNLVNIPILISESSKEQKAIAKILTAFDNKIELLQAQNKTLETMAQTIFKEWFGKYQIGDDLPEGWRIAKVNEFVKSSIGGDYGKETIEGDYTEETICLRGTDLPDMKMGTPKKAPIRFLKASKLERCKLENGDIVVEISGGTENQSTGRAMYINEKILSSAKHPMTCVNFCRIIRPLKLEYSYFLHSLFDYLYTRKVFFNWENGTTGIKNLNLKALLEDFDLFIPKNEDSILDFNKNVRAVFNKIQTNNTQIQSLIKTRDTLLPKLMSGQVRVNNLKNA